jgi:hypothetical protein
MNKKVNKETKKVVKKKEEKDASPDINIDSILSSGSSISNNENTEVVTNEVLKNKDMLDSVSRTDEIDTNVQLVKWLFAETDEKPAFLEKLLSDGDNRIKEVSMLTTLNNLVNMPKIANLKQTTLNSIIDSLNSIQFLSLQDKLSIFNTLDQAEKNSQERAFKYIQMARDFNSMPTIYRQLLDRLMILPDDKVPRMKKIPDLMELPDELWEQIVRIIDIYNNKTKK